MKEVTRRTEFGLKDIDFEAFVELLVIDVQQEFEALQWHPEIVRS